MKSGKQRRKKTKSKRALGSTKRIHLKSAKRKNEPPGRTVPVDIELLAAYNSYGAPAFVERGYYVDIPFHCEECGKEEVWTAAQQKWWYEVAKGE